MRYLAAVLLALPAAAQVCPSGYSHYRRITINLGQVGNGPLANYVMRIVNPTPDLAASTGYVQNANGYDIIIADSNGAKMTFETVRYDSSTGNAEFNVLIPSANNGTYVTLCFGNSAITTYQGSSSTWSGNYLVVNNFGTSSSLSVTDSSPSGNNGTNTGGTATTGMNAGDGAANFTANNQHVTYPNIGMNTDSTIELWLNYSTKSGPFFNKAWATEVAPYTVFDLDTDGSMHGLFSINASASNVCQATGTSVLPTNTWIYLVAVVDRTNSTLKYYYNGNLESSVSCSYAAATNGNAAWLNQYQFEPTQTNVAKYSELRVSNAVRSSDVILTTYRNISAPSSFYAVGNLDGAAGSGSFTITPSLIPSNHSGNITLTLVGNGTSWSSGTRFTISGVAGVTCVTGCSNSPVVTDSTHVSVVVTTSSGAGTLTLSTSGISNTTSVSASALTISPSSGNPNSIQTLTLSGGNTLWTKETAAGLFTVSGGAGASIGTATINSDTSATVALTVGSATGVLTITDTSTGATATFNAGGGSGTYGFVFGQ